MKRYLLPLAIFAVVCWATPPRNKPPNINDRNLMRGARCTVTNFSDKSPFREDIFGEVKAVVVSKTGDSSAAWVITFEDFDHCMLSFWTDGSELDKEIIVRSISSY